MLECSAVYVDMVLLDKMHFSSAAEREQMRAVFMAIEGLKIDAIKSAQGRSPRPIRSWWKRLLRHA